MKPCPFCAEQIQDAAIKCRFCGESLAVPESPPPPGTQKPIFGVVHAVWAAIPSRIRTASRRWKKVSSRRRLAVCLSLLLILGTSGFLIANPKSLYVTACSLGQMSACWRLGRLEQFDAGTLAEAKRLFAKACDGGEMRGCANLGFWEYEAGNTVEAKRLYAKACDGGEMGWCFLLAAGEETAGHIGEAARLYAKACDGGFMQGCSSLGDLEERAGDTAEARRLYTKACDAGLLPGCAQFGFLEEKAGNTAEARRLYAKVCDGGEFHGCGMLGTLEERAGNTVEAKRLYAKACDGGEFHGCNDLGGLAERAGILVEARRLYTKACDGGEMRGCANLGSLEEDAGNTVEAKRLSAKACDGGEMRGCANLGFWEYEAGNTVEAKRLYTKACDGGDMRGCFNLGVLANKAGNTVEAKRLFAKACNGGEFHGCFNLGVLAKNAGDTTEAKRLYAKACDGGEFTGCSNLGVLANNAGDTTEAKRLSAKACNGGEKIGCSNLRALEGNTGQSRVAPLVSTSILHRNQGSTVDQPGSQPAPTIDTSLATASGTTTGLQPCSTATSSASGQDSPVQRAEKLLAERGESGVPAAKAGEAVTVLEEAARTDPECAEVWSLLAYARYRRAYTPCSADDYSSAEEAAHRALDLSRDDGTKAASLRNMGRILAARSRWAEAQQQFEASLKLAAKNREAQTWLEDVVIAGQGPRPALLGAAGKAIRGEALDQTELSSLTKAELRWVANATLARQGRVLNRAPQDWFFFCDGSPLGARVPTAQKLSPATAIDRANMKLAKEVMKAAPAELPADLSPE